MAEIILDLFGGDKEFEELLEGIVPPLDKLASLTVTLVGDEARMSAAIAENSRVKAFAKRIKLIHAPEVLTNRDNPMLSAKGVSYSISAAFDYYCKTPDSCLISVGNTGAVIINSLVRLGLDEGVTKPALACVLPSDDGRLVCLADCGANLDVTEDDLLTFARLGAQYISRAQNITSPRVALLSVGREDGKGNAICKKAFTLLKESGLNFVGNAEPYDMLERADVVVCDGFAGNIILKNTEASGKRAIAALTASLGEESAAFKTAAGKTLRLFDFNSLGAAIILGAKKYVLKAHGAADASTVDNCIRQALPLVR